MKTYKVYYLDDDGEDAVIIDREKIEADSEEDAYQSFLNSNPKNLRVAVESGLFGYTIHDKHIKTEEDLQKGEELQRQLFTKQLIEVAVALKDKGFAKLNSTSKELVVQAVRESLVRYALEDEKWNLVHAALNDKIACKFIQLQMMQEQLLASSSGAQQSSSKTSESLSSRVTGAAAAHYIGEELAEDMLD
jgi:hypothetical protein